MDAPKAINESTVDTGRKSEHFLTALRSVLLAEIAVPFGLHPEEVLWVGYQLNAILLPLRGEAPTATPVAVLQEMKQNSSSRALEDVQCSQVGPAVFDSAVMHGSATEWATVLLSMITQGYSLRPLVQSEMHGRIVVVMRELGLDDPKNPRAALYLPTEVRHYLSRR